MADDAEFQGESQLYLDPQAAAELRRDFRVPGSVREQAAPGAGEGPHPKLARMIGLWRDLAPGPGLLPGRQHFDPMQVPDVLPNIWLLDVVRGDRLRYRVRLVGTAVTDTGAPMRAGAFLDELAEIPHAHIDAIFRDLMRDRGPSWRRGTPKISHSRFVSQLERVFLPFATDGVTVDLIMGVTVFYDGSGQAY